MSAAQGCWTYSGCCCCCAADDDDAVAADDREPEMEDEDARPERPVPPLPLLLDFLLVGGLEGDGTDGTMVAFSQKSYCKLYSMSRIHGWT